MQYRKFCCRNRRKITRQSQEKSQINLLGRGTTIAAKRRVSRKIAAFSGRQRFGRSWGVVRITSFVGPLWPSGAPMLDIQSRCRYSYSLSSYVLQVSQGIALYPPNLGHSQPKGGAKGGPAGLSQLMLRSKSNPAIEANRSYSIANRGLMSH